MKAVSIIYEPNERFGHFMERLIINLGPDPTWIPSEVQEQSSKLLFEIVSKRSNHHQWKIIFFALKTNKQFFIF